MDELQEARERLVNGLGRISDFWGFGKIMGQLYGVLYLSPEAMTLDQMATELGVSKGNVSVNIRGLERLGMVHRSWRRGDRKDYYEAETDFWKIVRDIMKEREKREFDQALSVVQETLDTVRAIGQRAPSEEAQFMAERLARLREFFDTLDKLAQTFLALDELRLGALEKLRFGLKR
jgi:DNA-binding transcriptional regulator GbsR (MarR family)